MILNLIKILFYATGTIVNIVKLAKLIKKTNTSKIGAIIK